MSCINYSASKQKHETMRPKKKLNYEKRHIKDRLKFKLCTLIP